MCGQPAIICTYRAERRRATAYIRSRLPLGQSPGHCPAACSPPLLICPWHALNVLFLAYSTVLFAITMCMIIGQKNLQRKTEQHVTEKKCGLPFSSLSPPSFPLFHLCLAVPPGSQARLESPLSPRWPWSSAPSHRSSRVLGFQPWVSIPSCGCVFLTTLWCDPGLRTC